VVAQFALAVVVVLAELLGPAWPGPLATVRVVTGSGIAAAGVVLFFAGTLALGRSLTPFPKPRDGASLNERGAYGVVRHPMYGGVILAIAGWSVARTPVGLVVTAVVGVFLELKSRREEAWLLARYPGYEVYSRRVRWKFFPGLR
jgi:protein-S-isoprenylcysteine O-methyltransferase Ste14